MSDRSVALQVVYLMALVNLSTKVHKFWLKIISIFKVCFTDTHTASKRHFMLSVTQAALWLDSHGAAQDRAMEGK